MVHLKLARRAAAKERPRIATIGRGRMLEMAKLHESLRHSQPVYEFPLYVYEVQASVGSPKSALLGSLSQPLEITIAPEIKKHIFTPSFFRSFVRLYLMAEL